MSLQKNLRATAVGLVVNLALGISKLVAGVRGHSDALIADSIESFADILAAFIVWRGLVVAAKPADEEHPYGHGKAEPLAAAGIGTLLLVAAGGIALHAFREFLSPQSGPEPYTLGVLIAVVIVKETLFRWVLSVSKDTDSQTVASDAWHHRSDAITSLAAAIGITLALLGGRPWIAADDIAALFAAGIIAWNGFSILRPALEDLMDAQPSPEILSRIRSAAAGVPEVDQIQKTLVRRMGNRLLVDMHVHVHPLMTVERSHRIAHQVKDTVRTAVKSVLDVLVHIEPSTPSSPANRPSTADETTEMPPPKTSPPGTSPTTPRSA